LFELSKWASNCPELIENDADLNLKPVTINDDATSRILGMTWNQDEDTFQFSYDVCEEHNIVSKRTILSGVARLFDPLGLLGPTIVMAKLILQELWQAGSHWDESVPQDIHTRWAELERRLTELRRLQVPRCVKFATDPHQTQIHGFCDTSQRAYGACIYIRMKLVENQFRTELLCSKSRVAPLKAVSLPRLELSAALLLSRLLNKVRESINITRMEVFLWSDSTITLNWISSPSRRWEAFVANRIGEIQRLTEIKNWRHITSPDNPADLLSRGLSPHELVDATMWWQGPAFLQGDEDQWPSGDFTHLGGEAPKRRKTAAVIVVSKHHIVDDLLKRHSNLTRAYRIIAYCLRTCKTYRQNATTKFVSHEEISRALEIACKMIQKAAFPSEHGQLIKGN